MGRENLGEVRDGSGEPPGGPGTVGGPSRRSGTGRVHYGKSRMGRGTHGECDEAKQYLSLVVTNL